MVFRGVTLCHAKMLQGRWEFLFCGVVVGMIALFAFLSEDAAKEAADAGGHIEGILKAGARFLHKVEYGEHPFDGEQAVVEGIFGAHAFIAKPQLFSAKVLQCFDSFQTSG